MCVFSHMSIHVCVRIAQSIVGGIHWSACAPRHQPRRAMPTVQKKTKARAVKRLLALGVTLRQVEPVVEACQEMLDVDADTLTKDFCGNVLADNDIAVVTRSLGSLDGTFCTITFQDAGDALRSHIKHDVEAERMFRDRMRACPRTWTLILSADEAVVGNALALSGRKTQVWSFSFLELGSDNLKLQSAWVTPMVMLSKEQSQLSGGCSAATAAFLEHALLSETNGFAKSGCPLPFGDDPVMLRATLHVKVVADGEAQRQFFQIKGASGLRGCGMCANVWTVKSKMAGRRPGYVSIACADTVKFKPNLQFAKTVDQILANQKNVRPGGLKQKDFEDMQKAHGVVPTEDGLLASKPLRPYVDIVQSYVVDWPHVMLQDGTVVIELDLFLGQHPVDAVRRRRWPTWFNRWTIPGYMGRAHIVDSKITELFSRGRIGGLNRPTNSELLSYCCLLRQFIQEEGLGVGTKELKSLLATFDLLDEVVMASRSHWIDDDAGLDCAAARLTVAAETALRAHIEAWGEGKVRPKHHWQMHFGLQLLRDLCLLATWVVERRHRWIKSIGRHVASATGYADHVAVALSNKMANKPKKRPGKTLRFRSILFRGPGAHGVTLKAGDMVKHGAQVGRLLGFHRTAAGTDAAVEPLSVKSMDKLSCVLAPCAAAATRVCPQDLTPLGPFRRDDCTGETFVLGNADI